VTVGKSEHISGRERERGSGIERERGGGKGEVDSVKETRSTRASRRKRAQARVMMMIAFIYIHIYGWMCSTACVWERKSERARE